MIKHVQLINSINTSRNSVLEDWGYTFLRLFFGVVILTHGIPKMLGNSHGSIIDPMQGTIYLIQHVMGLPFSEEIAILVMLLETIGALFISVGFLSRFVALAFSGQMIGICFALGPVWPWIDRGIEYPIILLVLSLYFSVKGSGRISIDNGVFWPKRKIVRN